MSWKVFARSQFLKMQTHKLDIHKLSLPCYEHSLTMIELRWIQPLGIFSFILRLNISSPKKQNNLKPLDHKEKATYKFSCYFLTYTFIPTSLYKKYKLTANLPRFLSPLQKKKIRVLFVREKVIIHHNWVGYELNDWMAIYKVGNNFIEWCKHFDINIFNQMF